MIKGLLLLFDTARTWELIAHVPRRWALVLVNHFIPLLLLTSLAEGYSLAHWGRLQVITHRIKIFSPAEAVGYETAQALLTLAMLFISAKLVKSLGDTFHGRHTFGQAVVALAYGMSPLLLLRFFNVIPTLSPWATWAVGIILTVAILYYGLPCIMQPDPPHAFGLYLVTSLLLILISGLIRFLTAWYLIGKFERLNELLAR